MMRERYTINRQQGIVLFIAMIALVVMSLAAAALIRSVDTNTKIASNLSFKQSALTAADRGVETAITWLEAQSTDTLDETDKAKAYFAVYGSDDVGDLDEPKAAKWNVAALATGEGVVAGVDSATKNEIRYIIERMCERTGPPEEFGENRCLFSLVDGGRSGLGSLDNEGIQGEGGGGDTVINPMYRITVQVKGPKNTESYTQVYAF